jgi:hypothetical protein
MQSNKTRNPWQGNACSNAIFGRVEALPQRGETSGWNLDRP